VTALNVLFVGIDTLGAGHCGCYGYGRDTTPRLDALARRGVRLANHYTVSPTCTPSWTSLLTGWAPTHHRVMATCWMWENLHSQVLDDAVPTLPEMFQAAGWQTAAFSFLPTLMAHHPSWFTRGFETFVNPYRSLTRSRDMSCTSADQINRRLFPWLEQHRDEPFFAFVTYWEPHQPYYHAPEFADRFAGDELPTVETPHGPYIPGFGLAEHLTPETRRNLDRYDRSVAYVDDRLGRLVDKLEELDLLDDTLLVVTADHGESMMEHGIAFEHRGNYDPVTRVPMVFVHPSLPAGGIVTDFTQAIDLAPTLLALAALRPAFQPEVDAMDGADLSAALAGGPLATSRPVVTEQAEDLALTRALHTQDWMFQMRFAASGLTNPVRYPGYSAERELYHRTTDPYLLDNVAEKYPMLVVDLEEHLRHWVDLHLRPGQSDPLLDPLLYELNVLRREGDIRWRWDDNLAALRKTHDATGDSAPERRG
jgi:arylsulfatase A-like enzyme